MSVPVVLVVDDEALLRMLAAEHFAEAGFEVLEAANGEQAAALMRSRDDIKAVVTDVQMPGSPDGFALSHLVRDLCPDCAIVVVSGRAYPSDGDMAAGARYMPKPYQGGEMVAVIRSLLAPGVADGLA